MRVGISECGGVGFRGATHTIDGFVVGIDGKPVLNGTWSFVWVFGLASFFSVAGLATIRIGVS